MERKKAADFPQELGAEAEFIRADVRTTTMCAIWLTASSSRPNRAITRSTSVPSTLVSKVAAVAIG